MLIFRTASYLYYAETTPEILVVKTKLKSIFSLTSVPTQKLYHS